MVSSKTRTIESKPKKHYRNKWKRTLNPSTQSKVDESWKFMEKNYLPEHLYSWSWRSATFCPLKWLGVWHLVYGAKRGALRKKRDNHDKWQSHENGLSDNRRARKRGIPANKLGANVVMLLLFKVLFYMSVYVHKYQSISRHSIADTSEKKKTAERKFIHMKREIDIIR